MTIIQKIKFSLLEVSKNVFLKNKKKVLQFIDACQKRWRRLVRMFHTPATMPNLFRRKWFDLLQSQGISESNRLIHKDQHSPVNLGFSCRRIRGAPRWAPALVEQRCGILARLIFWKSITSVSSVMSARVKGQNVTYLQTVLSQRKEEEKRKVKKTELHQE